METYLPSTPTNSKQRKPDAFLAVHRDISPTQYNGVVSVEFTESAPPNLAGGGNPLLLHRGDKLRQAVTNACDFLQYTRRTRHYVFALAFFGKRKDAAVKPARKSRSCNPPPTPGRSVVLIVLDHEVLRLHLLPDCFGANLPSTVALLDALRRSSLLDLGFSPVFDYSYAGGDPDAALRKVFAPALLTPLGSPFQPLVPGDIVPRTLYLPPSSYVSTTPFDPRRPLRLVGPPLGDVVGSPFSRSTLVFRATAEGTNHIFVVKMQYVADSRTGREASVLKHLWRSDGRPVPPSPAGPDAPPPPPASYALPPSAASEAPPLPLLGFPLFGPPTYAPTITYAFIAAHTPSQSVPSVSFNGRHLEVLVMDTDSAAIRLDQLSTGEAFLRAMSELVEAIQHAAHRGVLHRDLSSANILATPVGKLVWIDWDCATTTDADSSTAAATERTGTLDTMAIDRLECSALNARKEFQHKARHDLESAAYLVWKTLLPRIPVLEGDEKAWGVVCGVAAFGGHVHTHTRSALAGERSKLWATGLVGSEWLLSNFAEDALDLVVLARRPGVAELLRGVAGLAEYGLGRAAPRRRQQPGETSEEVDKLCARFREVLRGAELDAGFWVKPTEGRRGRSAGLSSEG